MKQEELDEISNAFQEAWDDIGDTLYYVQLDTSDNSYDTLYREQKHKKYDYVNKKMFHGTMKESPSLDEKKQTGNLVNRTFTLSLVTKELIDKGITQVRNIDIIQYIDRFGKEHLYKIVDDYQKVQLSSNRIFTKIEVIPYEH